MQKADLGTLPSLHDEVNVTQRCRILVMVLAASACGGTPADTSQRDGAAEDGTEATDPGPAALGREACDGSVQRFAFCEGQATYVCHCPTPDSCRIIDTTCPWVSGSPLSDDTGLWCCTECEGIVEGVAEYDICS